MSRALIVSHPGHELRAFRWMERHAPQVLVLTDGSGLAGQPRIKSTSRILELAGARPGPIYGRCPDREFYHRLLAGDREYFLDLAAEIARFLESAGIDTVVGDAAEGRETSHDVCRYLVDAACARTAGVSITAYQLSLFGHPDPAPAARPAGALTLRLDAAAQQRKIAAALGYSELAAEIEQARRMFGAAAFAAETLLPATLELGPSGRDGEIPPYERLGEQRVAEGVFRKVIRYREHVAPVREALAAWACA
jgi:hypothetical protein